MDAQERIAAQYNLPQSVITQVIAGLGLNGYAVIEDGKLAELTADALRWRGHENGMYVGPIKWEESRSYETGDVVSRAEPQRRSFVDWLLRRPKQVEHVKYQAVSSAGRDG